MLRQLLATQSYTNTKGSFKMSLLYDRYINKCLNSSLAKATL